MGQRGAGLDLDKVETAPGPTNGMAHDARHPSPREASGHDGLRCEEQLPLLYSAPCPAWGQGVRSSFPALRHSRLILMMLRTPVQRFSYGYRKTYLPTCGREPLAKHGETPHHCGVSRKPQAAMVRYACCIGVTLVAPFFVPRRGQQRSRAGSLARPPRR